MDHLCHLGVTRSRGHRNPRAGSVGSDARNATLQMDWSVAAHYKAKIDVAERIGADRSIDLDVLVELIRIAIEVRNSVESQAALVACSRVGRVPVHHRAAGRGK